jgi:hypothetical protein
MRSVVRLSDHAGGRPARRWVRDHRAGAAALGREVEVRPCCCRVDGHGMPRCVADRQHIGAAVNCLVAVAKLAAARSNVSGAANPAARISTFVSLCKSFNDLKYGCVKEGVAHGCVVY